MNRIWQKVKDAWGRIKRWNLRLRPLYRLYLGLLLSLGLAQGIVSLIVLLLSPDSPVGSR